MVAPARRAAAIATALLLLAGLGEPRASAQSVTEFPVPTAGSGLQEIAMGPDGALWFAEFESSKIGRITTTGAFSEFQLPTGFLGGFPKGIATGPDGKVWFAEAGSNTQIGRITTTGNMTFVAITSTSDSITPGPDGALWFTEASTDKIGRLSRSDTSDSEFPIASTTGTNPRGITTGPDGALWFTLLSDGKIVRLDPATGTPQPFSLPISSSSPIRITKGSDGALWFTETGNDKIGRITTSGTLREFPLPQNSGPFGITAGPDGAMWFTESTRNMIGRIGGSGSLTEFPISTSGSSPLSIVTGPDGALWFTDIGTNSIGRFSVPAATTPLFSATLPASRSIQIGHTATAFATIINTGAAAANCGIVPVTTVPGSFTFQTTDPKTNALTGSPNTRVNIAAGKSQSFVVAFSPAATADFAQVPINVVLGYACDGDDAAETIVGVNTILLTFDANPVPDVIAIGLTPSNDGFAHTSGVGGTGLFATASSNVGVGGTLTARVRLSDPTLPITATVCETNPNNGACLSPPSPTVTATINQGQNQTWSVFLQANGSVAADPAHNRAFFEFVDSDGVVRGSTSTAVTTQ